jgi:prepilin-type N-terminal cleavage/methylation domain-containing protein
MSILVSRSTHSSYARVRGFTLIELLVVIVILALIMSIGVPSFFSIIERNRLAGAAQTLYGDMQFARAEAIKQDHDVYLKLDTSAWCYGIDDTSSATCSCGTGSGCMVDGMQHIVSGDAFPGLSMTASLAGTSVTFDSVRGTMGPSGSVFFQSSNGDKLRLVMSPLGRVKLCVASGGVAGFKAC